MRLDRLVVARGLAPSRERAQELIAAGQVLVAGLPRDKAGSLVDAEAGLALDGPPLPFVSRGGIKLERALDFFSLDVAGIDCLDVGASTGGFTDCLLQRGAQSVIALDVGYGQLATSLRQDPRVRVMERQNVRFLTPEMLPRRCGFASVDVSFISLRLAVPPVLDVLLPGARIVCLIKPQFEVGKGEVGKGGVVRDPEKHARVTAEITEFFLARGLGVSPAVESPVLGPAGNREFLAVLTLPG
jgi:23S rRNA (cytidine1920-2'-O)/16S rRNA (cytidine1409-2'-O)-methyltransferase